MKLLRLRITDPLGFRSLPSGFEIGFPVDEIGNTLTEVNPYIFVGPNGSGKSNAMEAIASIFYHIECIYLNSKPVLFDYEENDSPLGFRPESSKPDGFELEYLTPTLDPNDVNKECLAHVIIEKKCSCAPLICWKNNEGIVYDQLSSIEIKKLLPDFVLAHSSGNNEILSLPFLKMRYIQYDEYISRLLRQEGYSGTPEGRLTFLSDEYSQAILICNFILQNEQFLKPFMDTVGIVRLDRMRIIIKDKLYLSQNHFEELQLLLDVPLSADNDVIHSVETDNGFIHILSITKYLEGRNGIISKLQACATCCFYNKDTNEWHFDYYINEETKNAFSHHFDSSLELFQSLQVLLTLNLYSTNRRLKHELYQSDSLFVNETVPTLASDERIMRFKNIYVEKKDISHLLSYKALSDGEHQYIHLIGLCLLYRDKNCIFLLDEPETHFNPSWRAQIISSIKSCFAVDDDNISTIMRDVLITTHTPYLVSDSKANYVYLFSSHGSQQEGKISKPQYNTFGASIGQISSWTFRQESSIGNYAQYTLQMIENKIEEASTKSEYTDLLIAANRLGDSAEKILLMEKIIGYMEMM